MIWAELHDDGGGGNSNSLRREDKQGKGLTTLEPHSTVVDTVPVHICKSSWSDAVLSELVQGDEWVPDSKGTEERH